MSYQNLMYIGLALAFFMLVVSIMCFIRLDIPKVVGSLTGYTARKAIKEMRRGEKAGKSGKQSAGRSRGFGQTGRPAPSMPEPGQPPFAVDPNRTETLPAPGSNATTVLQTAPGSNATTVLQTAPGSNATTVLQTAPGGNATTVLQPAPGGNATTVLQPAPGSNATTVLSPSGQTAPLPGTSFSAPVAAPIAQPAAGFRFAMEQDQTVTHTQEVIEEE